MAYLGLLGGPVAIGAAASGVGLRDALLIPAALAVLVAFLAGVMSPHGDRGGGAALPGDRPVPAHLAGPRRLAHSHGVTRGAPIAAMN